MRICVVQQHRSPFITQNGSSNQSLFQSLIFQATQSYVRTVCLIIMVMVCLYISAAICYKWLNDLSSFPDHEVLWVQLHPKCLLQGISSLIDLSSTWVHHWERVYARTLVPISATCWVMLPWLHSYCGRRLPQ